MFFTFSHLFRAFSKETVTPVLLNTLDSTKYYIGSYARDARLRPSKGRPITFDDGGHLRRAEAAAMVHHHHRPARRLPQGVLGNLGGKDSVPRGDFVAC